MVFRAVAPSAQCGLTQATRLWPNRSTASDGTLGDASHSSRESDHNPDARGIVHAWDLTNDPAAGCDNDRNAQSNLFDPRLKYRIWKGRIWNPSIASEWRPYDGENPHVTHMHTSVESFLENDTSDWFARIRRTVRDLNIMNRATKRYFDGQFAAINARNRRMRETQLRHGIILRNLMQGQAASQEDLAALDEDIEAISDDLADGNDPIIIANT